MARQRALGRVIAMAAAALTAVAVDVRGAAAFSIGGRSLDNRYTVFIVSGVIVTGWLALFALLTIGRGDR